MSAQPESDIRYFELSPSLPLSLPLCKRLRLASFTILFSFHGSMAFDIRMVCVTVTKDITVYDNDSIAWQQCFTCAQWPWFQRGQGPMSHVWLSAGLSWASQSVELAPRSSWQTTRRIWVPTSQVVEHCNAHSSITPETHFHCAILLYLIDWLMFIEARNKRTCSEQDDSDNESVTPKKQGKKTNLNT